MNNNCAEDAAPCSYVDLSLPSTNNRGPRSNSNITSNSNGGIYLNSGADGDLSGLRYADVTFPFNAIGYNNSYDIINSTAPVVDASWNTWENDNPDVQGPVQTDPQFDGGLAKSSGNLISLKYKDEFEKVDKLVADSSYKKALKILDTIIRKEPEQPITFRALLKMRGISYMLKDRDYYITKLKKYIARYSNTYIGKKAYYLSVSSLLQMGHKKKAITRLNHLIKKYKQRKKSDEKIAWLLFDRAKIKEFLNDDNSVLSKISSAQAKKDLSTIVEDYSQTEAAQHVAERYGMNRKGDTPDQSTPEEFSLDDNYPNPFNPTTNITYQLPKNCRVTLTIYNIRGQKIRTLLDRNMEAGYKSVKWRGRNNAGQRVSSGIYIYKLHTSTGFEKTKKILLVK